MMEDIRKLIDKRRKLLVEVGEINSQIACLQSVCNHGDLQQESMMHVNPKVTVITCGKCDKRLEETKVWK